MTNQLYDIIFIAGAPGAGKSSVAKALQVKLNGPCFEFGWIPEFRNTGTQVIPYTEEEAIAFENLTLVVQNYIQHGFKNIIITDLEDKRIQELHKVFQTEKYILFTLTVEDDQVLKARVLTENRCSKYRDHAQAIEINSQILARDLLANEIRIDTTQQSIADVVEEITRKV